MYPPELCKIVELAQQGKFDVLICRSLTRLARDDDKMAAYKRIFSDYDVRIEYYKYEFEPTPEGELIEGILTKFAKYERAITAFRTHFGKRNKVKSGKVYVNGIPPYGYKEHNKEVGGEIVERTLKVIPEEAEVIQEIFELFTGDKSVNAASIARHLTDRGIAPPGHTRYVGEQFKLPANAFWYGQTVRKLLKRKTYAGTWEYGKKGDEATIPVTVEPIISQDTWQIAHDKIQSVAKLRASISNYTFLLSDGAVCGGCGSVMRGRARKEKSGNTYYHYVCPKDHISYGSDRCTHNSTYRADMVDKFLWQDVKQILSCPDKLTKAYSLYKDTIRKKDNPLETKLKAKQNLIRKKNNQLKRLADMRIDGDISKNEYRKRKTKLEDDMNRHKVEEATLQADIESATNSQKQRENLDEFISTVPELLAKPEHDIDLKKQIIERLGISTVMHPSDNGTYKHADWFLLTPSAFGVEPQSRLWFVLGCEPATR